MSIASAVSKREGIGHVRFDAHEGIKCYAVTCGQCWLVVEGTGEPVLLETDDCFILPLGLPFRLASDPELPPDDWRRHFLSAPNGTFIKLDQGSNTMLLGGHFGVRGPQAEMLLGMLPPILHLHSRDDREALRWTFRRLQQELAAPQPGSLLIAQQLCHMVLVQALRLHLCAKEQVGWLFALADRQIGAALAVIHNEPSRRWSVELLATEVAMSRAAFAARFRKLVGEGPIEYLTRWRMLLASRSLSRGNSVDTVAHALGYESASAFSTAFKRVMGRSPRHKSARAGGEQ